MNVDHDGLLAALDEIEAATARLVTAVSALSADELRTPSLLPGWSRAHVITHVARNADSHRNLLEWARTGIETPQYESAEQRNRDIEAGLDRSPAEMAEDVRASGARFAAAVRTLPDPAWQATVRAFTGWPHPAWYIVFRRWREVEVHHSDLGLGYTHRDWSDAYVRWELADTLDGLGARGALAGWRIRVTDTDTDAGAETETGRGGGAATAAGTEGPVAAGEISGTAREVLAWLAGRTDATALRVDGPAGAAPPHPPDWPGEPSPGMFAARR